MKNKFVFLILMMVIFGCKENHEKTKMDEDTFLRNLESAPAVIVPIEDLPEWLSQTIEDLIINYVGKAYTSLKPAEIYRGEWNKRTVYYITHPHSSCALCFYDEKSERILLGSQEDLIKFYSLSKKWELIFQISDGIVIVGELARGK